MSAAPVKNLSVGDVETESELQMDEINVLDFCIRKKESLKGETGKQKPVAILVNKQTEAEKKAKAEEKKKKAKAEEKKAAEKKAKAEQDKLYKKQEEARRYRELITFQGMVDMFSG